MSTPNISVVNLDIGSCRVTYNGVDLGASLSNVTVTMKYDKAPLKADQTGTWILDKAVSGGDITVTTELAETRDKAIWNVVFPSADLSGVSPADYLDFKDKTGTRDLPRAQVLILHPLVELDSNLNLDYYFYKVLADENSTSVLGPAEQRKLKIIWQVFPDTSVSPFRWMRFGDHTL